MHFDPPRPARCSSLDGTWSTDCLILSVWETGARLLLQRPTSIVDLLIAFSSGPMPVFRQGRRTRTNGNELEVEYKREKPSGAT